MEELAVWALEAEKYFTSLYFVATTIMAVIVSFVAVVFLDI